ncbi:MAG: GH116 family glycosyl-hydrolase [Armatimonadota bacterium]
MNRGCLVALCALIALACGGNSHAASRTLFPIDLPTKDWVHFKAAGFSEPVCGVIYHKGDTVTNGMALGGVDTGCIDLETSGLLGYCTIFNTHVPRRGPINLPILGMSVGGKTWVLCEKQPKQGWGGCQVPVEPVFTDLKLDGVQTAKEIHYWGHYPVADLEFETDAPVSVGMRAWSPFLPGAVVDSMIPGIVFEVHLRNTSTSAQKGTIAFSFPGPTKKEAGSEEFSRQEVNGGFNGVEVTAENAKYPMSYAIGVLGGEQPRVGGELGADGAAWARITEGLPGKLSGEAGASAAVDFALTPGKEKIVRYVLTWQAPTWSGGGYNWSESDPKYNGGGFGMPKSSHHFTHMYAKYYPDAVETARFLAKNHKSLLARTLAWQQVIYTENKLPVWLRDSLINVLYMITEDGLWAQKADPLPAWVKEEDGLFGLIECPRGCPQIECIPCSFYGSLPLTYFFPELQLSTIRGYQGYQGAKGDPPWVFGQPTGFATPATGHNYQASTNGISLAGIVDRFLLCRDTPDKKYAKELYPMMKRCMEWQVKIGVDGNPSFSLGQQLLAMPNFDGNKEWFEADHPGWFGAVAHVGILHIAQLRIMERMAKNVGDAQFAKQCSDWIKAAQDAMENTLWDNRGYYLNCFDPTNNQKNEMVFGYQLDGEWITDHHGLPETVPEARVRTVLDTIKKCNIALTKYGAVNYANPDATPIGQAKQGTWDYGQFSYFPPEALMLAMNYMYEGQKEFGVELARKVWHNLFCLQGYTWDMPNIMRGDVDTGERSFGNDYYQDMMLWSLPAAMEDKPLDAPVKTGGLVDRVIKAAAKH